MIVILVELIARVWRNLWQVSSEYNFVTYNINNSHTNES